MSVGLQSAPAHHEQRDARAARKCLDSAAEQETPDRFIPRHTGHGEIGTACLVIRLISVGSLLPMNQRGISSRCFGCPDDVLQFAVAQHVHAIESVENLLVMRDCNHRSLLVDGQLAQQIHRNLCSP